MAKQVDIAWAAGLFEGEGCIFISKNRGGSSQARLEIRMTDEDVLNRFCAIVNRGKVVSRDYDQAPNSLKRVYKWGVYNVEGVRHVLKLFTPYLGERRLKKADEVLEEVLHIKSIRKEVILT